MVGCEIFEIEGLDMLDFYVLSPILGMCRYNNSIIDFW